MSDIRPAATEYIVSLKAAQLLFEKFFPINYQDSILNQPLGLIDAEHKAGNTWMFTEKALQAAQFFLADSSG